VSVMAFGRHPRNESDTVLTRLCIKDGYHVVGGATKLFKNALKQIDSDEIISWSDNDISYGNVYEKMGFELAEELKPDYKYGHPHGHIFSKQSQKKNAVNCPEHLTEVKWAHSRGLFRFWNAGKIRWAYYSKKE